MENTFELSSHIDHNKAFIINRSDIEGRLDAEYYRPEILLLEHKVRALSSKKLRNYICHISSGATPSVKEEEKFYSNEENGIPFLRVQNLQPNGTISLEDVKHINQDTHENYLRRSQVGEYDLLIKITGVGRMAIASVAPSGFVGNTNQHMVVIKTDDKSTSDYLANYLNLDIVEKLASRRSTGGTRPALDYPALKSIPIVEDIDFSPIQKAEIAKKQKEAGAKALLDGIDDYLRGELGITLPKNENLLSRRIFTTNFSEIGGERIDSNYRLKYTHLINQQCAYTRVSLKDIINKRPQYGANEEAVDGNVAEETRYIRITDIDDYGNLKLDGWKTAAKVEDKYRLNKNDILFARSGSVGRCYIHKSTDNDAIFAGYLIRFVLNDNIVNPDYIFYYCNSEIYKFWVDAIQRPAVQANINAEEYKSLPIALPPIEKQNEIANYISEIRSKAKVLQQEAQDILDQAKREVEQIILGE